MPSDQALEMHERMAEMVELLSGDGETEPTLEEMRASYDHMVQLTAEPGGVTWTEVDAGGVPAIWADAEGGSTDHVIQYMHGGAYVIGSADYYRKLTGHIAAATGCRVLNVDYRLAPEHPHPAPVEDSTTAYRWLLDQGYAPEHIALSGDSAGGGLTLSTLIWLRDHDVALPAAAVPISPWADLEGLGQSMVDNAENDVLVNIEMLKAFGDMFLAGQDPRDPLAAPVHANYESISPLYIQVGGDETLLDDATRVAEAAEAAGVDVTLEVFPQMQHVFQIGAGNVPEADEALEKMASFVRPRLGL